MSWTPKRALLVVVAVVAVMLPLSSAPAAAEAEVMVIGDSLCEGARDQGGLVASLSAQGIAASLYCLKGQPASWGISTVQSLGTVPATVVVELGTNPSASASAFRGEIDTMVAALRARGAERIAWVTAIERGSARYAEQNLALRQQAQSLGFTVADWAGVAQSHWFVSDSIHYTGTGYAEFASFLTNAVVALRSGTCVVAQPGDGWWVLTERLGMSPWRWPEVQAANPAAVNAGGQVVVGRVVCAPGATTNAPPVVTAAGGSTSPTSGSCVIVERGDGWWVLTGRLGLQPWTWPVVAAANLGATNASGHLVIGRQVCAPGVRSTTPAPTTSPTTSTPAPASSGSCTTVQSGDGWWLLAERLGLPGWKWPAVRDANPAAANAAGYLLVGRQVCAPA